MDQLAVLTPVVLLLLMLLLGRFERWLDASTPPPPARPGRRRWRGAPRAVRPVSVEVGAGRRLLTHRSRAAARRRPAAAGASGAVPRAGRRQLLGGRLRSRDR